MPEPARSTLERFAAAPVVAVLRAATAARFGAVAETLVEAGITSVEVTMTTEGALEAIMALRTSLPAEAFLGVGTVRTPDQLRAAADAGAEYAVTPHVRMDLIETAVALGLPIVPGAATPSEVAAAWEAGATAVKIFPVSNLGGPAYLKALAGPLPDIPFIPSGGVRIEQIAEYLGAGATAVGVSGPLIGDAGSDGGDLGALAERARAAAAAARVR